MTVGELLPEHRDRMWVDREGHRWRYCTGGICNCWERQEAAGWLRTERTLRLADYAPFTADNQPQEPEGWTHEGRAAA